MSQFPGYRHRTSNSDRLEESGAGGHASGRDPGTVVRPSVHRPPSRPIAITHARSRFDGGRHGRRVLDRREAQTHGSAKPPITRAKRP